MVQCLFVGDVMLGRLVNNALKTEAPGYPWGDCLPLFQAAGVRICNLECVLSNIGQPWSVTPKVFHFRSDEQNVAVLKAAGIDAVSLANNHVLDYEYEALFRMRDVLAASHIHFAGAGVNLTEASRPALWTSQNTRIGLIAFTDNEPDWQALDRGQGQATDEQPGVFYVPVDLLDSRAAYLFELVRKTRAAVDFLVVSAHWGPNWGYRPQPAHLPFAQALVDAGADVVFGHSCHVFQGVALHSGKPILFSTGDFIDDYKVDEVEKNDQSFIFVLDTEGHRPGLSLYPTIIRSMQARKAAGLEQRDIALKMADLCREFNTAVRWNNRAKCLQLDVG